MYYKSFLCQVQGSWRENLQDLSFFPTPFQYVSNLFSFFQIKQEIIDAAPTDGLWDDGRNDETQIGATYAELEWAMAFEKNRGLTKREEKVFKIYQTLNAKNKHKMQPIPICRIPKILRN